MSFNFITQVRKITNSKVRICHFQKNDFSKNVNKKLDLLYHKFRLALPRKIFRNYDKVYRVPLYDFDFCLMMNGYGGYKGKSYLIKKDDSLNSDRIITHEEYYRRNSSSLVYKNILQKIPYTICFRIDRNSPCWYYFNRMDKTFSGYSILPGESSYDTALAIFEFCMYCYDNHHSDLSMDELVDDVIHFLIKADWSFKNKYGWRLYKDLLRVFKHVIELKHQKKVIQIWNKVTLKSFGSKTPETSSSEDEESSGIDDYETSSGEWELRYLLASIAEEAERKAKEKESIAIEEVNSEESDDEYYNDLALRIAEPHDSEESSNESPRRTYRAPPPTRVQPRANVDEEEKDYVRGSDYYDFIDYDDYDSDYLYED